MNHQIVTINNLIIRSQLDKSIMARSSDLTIIDIGARGYDRPRLKFLCTHRACETEVTKVIFEQKWLKSLKINEITKPSVQDMAVFLKH